MSVPRVFLHISVGAPMTAMPFGLLTIYDANQRIFTEDKRGRGQIVAARHREKR
jgi:hypothetical protein